VSIHGNPIVVLETDTFERTTAMTTRLTLLISLAAASFGFFASPVQSDDAPLEVHTVTAAQAVAMGYRGRTPANESQVVLYAKSEHVRYADLDLSKLEDVATLMERLDTAAQKACKEIGEKHAESMPRTSVCAREATDRALVSLQRQMDAKGRGQFASTN
jgi:UrcA family protein